jgi:hypothetical protein
MEAFDGALEGQPMNDDQADKMKMAVLQALKDVGEIGPEAQARRIDENKLGALQALKDSGLAKDIQKAATVPDNPEIDAIPYKDAPEDIKRQMEAKAGLQPSQTISPVGSDQIVKHQQLQHQQEQADKQSKLQEAQFVHTVKSSETQTELQREQMKTKGGANGQSKKNR